MKYNLSKMIIKLKNNVKKENKLLIFQIHFSLTLQYSHPQFIFLLLYFSFPSRGDIYQEAWKKSNKHLHAIRHIHYIYYSTRLILPKVRYVFKWRIYNCWKCSNLISDITFD